MSVGVEASVQDAKGQFVRNLPASDFSVFEDGISRRSTRLTSEATPATFALLVDSSQSMSRNIGFVQNAAGKLTKYLRDIDTVVVAPFRNGITTITGPDARFGDDRRRRQGDQAIRRHGDYRRARRCGRTIRRRRRPARGRAHHRRLRRTQSGQADEVLEKLKTSRVTVYVISIGGVAGVSHPRRTAAPPHRQRDRRPGVLPLERAAARRGARHHHR